MDDARMLTVEQVAEQLGLSKHQVYRRISRRDLPAVLTRSPTLHYRISQDAVDAYAKNRDNTTTSVNASMLRASEVAAMTGFTVETVRRMAYAGTLPYVRGTGPNGHLRIPRAAVEDYLSRR